MIPQEDLHLSDLNVRAELVAEFRESASSCFESEADSPDKIDALIDLKQAIEGRVYRLERDVSELKSLSNSIKTFIRKLSEDAEQLITSLEGELEEEMQNDSNF